MAEIYRNTRCMRCGKHHTLYDTGTVRHSHWETHSYTCPAENRLTKVAWLGVPEVVEVVPDDAIPMQWVSDCQDPHQTPQLHIESPGEP